MNKKLIKILSLILAVVAVMTICSSCKKKHKEDNADSNTPTDNDNQFEETSYNLVDDCESPYVIVISDDPARNELFAKDELVTIFRYSTGIRLPVIASADAVDNYNAESHYIILGNALGSVSPVSKDLPFEHFAIKVKDSNVFIKGGNDTGVLYGVYRFLHEEIGYECYATDCLVYDRDVRNLKLLDLDIEDGPDFVYREPNYGPLRSNPTFTRRMRISENMWMLEHGNFIHNSFSEYFPKDKYEKEHPEYYSTGNPSKHMHDHMQLCYTGHGNSETVKAMQAVVVSRIKELVNKNYSKGKFIHNISFTQEDVRTWCTCPHCEAMKEKYGKAYASAAVVQFINPVAREIKQWMNETWPGEELNIVVFAYHLTTNAPVKEENGKYVAIDESVIPEDNVGILYAPIDMNFNYNFSHKVNREWNEIFEKWSAISNNMYLWSYSQCADDYFAWYDSFNSMQPIYKKAQELNARYIFDQSKYNTDALTGFDTLKLYLNSNLAWDVDADMNTLINKFFDNYFGPASSAMKEYFDAYRSYMAYVRAVYPDFSGNIFDEPKKKHYPKQVLMGWLEYIDKAYKAIEPLKTTDVEMYNSIYARINIESLAMRIHLIIFYPETYSFDEFNALKSEFIHDAKQYGFSLFAEYTYLDDIIATW